MQGFYAFPIPQWRSAEDTFITPDVCNLELEALTCEHFFLVNYVEICKRISHVITVHNSVCVVAASGSPVSGLVPKPRKVCWADQVRLPIWHLTADCAWISVVGKRNTLDRGKIIEIVNFIKRHLFFNNTMSQVFVLISSIHGSSLVLAFSPPSLTCHSFPYVNSRQSFFIT